MGVANPKFSPIRVEFGRGKFIALVPPSGVVLHHLPQIQIQPPALHSMCVINRQMVQELHDKEVKEVTIQDK